MGLTQNFPGVCYSPMQVRFLSERLDRLETDARDDGRYSQAIVSAYRRRLQTIRAAQDERDLRALKSLHFEKLQGDRSGEYSMRLNDQYRLILRLEAGSASRVVVIVAIEDYH